MVSKQTKKRHYQAPKNRAEEDEKPANYGKRAWYAIGFASAAVTLAATFYFVYYYPVPGWEQAGFSFVNDWPDRLRYAAISVTALGGTWMAVASVIVTFILKMFWLSWRLAFSVLIGYASIYGLKLLTGRPRPGELFESAHVRAVESGFGFPSGHTMLITVVMLTLLLYLPRFWRWVFALVLIVAVGLSRIYLGLHLPLDVVGGVALGVLIVCFIRILPNAVRRTLRLGG